LQVHTQLDLVIARREARRQGDLTIAITNSLESQLAATAELVLALGAGAENSVPASKTYTASVLALALISQGIDQDAVFEAALRDVPKAIAAAIANEPQVAALVPRLAGQRAIVLGRGFNFSTADEIALKLSETSYVLARAWSVSDFEHGPIAIVESGLPVILVDGGGPLEAELQPLRQRLAAMGCDLIELTDRTLPEELTPITLAVQGQLLALHVAAARGIDPDRPRAIHKVTKTW